VAKEHEKAFSVRGDPTDVPLLPEMLENLKDKI
jgi:hypothetical protein